MEEAAACLVQALTTPNGRDSAAGLAGLPILKGLLHLAVALPVSEAELLCSNNLRLEALSPFSIRRTERTLAGRAISSKRPTLATCLAGGNSARWDDLTASDCTPATCTQFVAVPLLTSAGCCGALVLGTASAAQLKESMRLGLLLASHLMRAHGQQLQGLADAVSIMLRPPRPPLMHLDGSPLSDNESECSSDDEESDSEGEGNGYYRSPADVGGGAQRQQPLRLGSVWEGLGGRVLLQFKDKAQEQEFMLWHAQLMTKLDALGLLLHACILIGKYWLNASYMLARKLSSSELLMGWAGIITAGLLLALAPAFYQRHRSAILVAFKVHVLIWMLRNRNYMELLTHEDFSHRVLTFMSWATITPITLQLPVRVLAPVLPALVAVNCSLLPSLCTTFYTQCTLTSCVWGWVFKIFLRSILLPLLVVYTAELWSRRNFLSSQVQRRRLHQQ